MKPVVAVLLAIAWSSPAGSQDEFWVDRDGNPTPDTEARKSVDGFGGWLLVTPDPDWDEKWRTSPETIPHYNEASTVSIGETLMTLIFFANPMVGEDGIVDVRCDLRVVRPDGSFSVEMTDYECFKGPIQGSPSSIRLSNALLGFVGEPDDQRGEWVTEVRLTDMVRSASVELTTRFELVDD